MSTLSYVAVPAETIAILHRAEYPRTVGGELTWRKLSRGAVAYYLFLCEKANRAGESWWGVRTAAEELSSRLGETLTAQFVQRVKTWRRQLLAARLDDKPLVESFRREGMLTWTTRVLHRVRSSASSNQSNGLSRRERAALRYDWRSDVVDGHWKATPKRVAKLELRIRLLESGQPDPLRHHRSGAPGVPPNYEPRKVPAVTTEKAISDNRVTTSGETALFNSSSELAPGSERGCARSRAHAHVGDRLSPATDLSAPDGAHGAAAPPVMKKPSWDEMLAVRRRIVAALVNRYSQLQLPSDYREWSLAAFEGTEKALLVPNHSAARCKLQLAPEWRKIATNAANECEVGRWICRNGFE